MNDTNLALLEKNRDILSTRDLATGTIATYTSYLTNYINWVEEIFPAGASLTSHGRRYVHTKSITRMSVSVENAVERLSCCVVENRSQAFCCIQSSLRSSNNPQRNE